MNLSLRLRFPYYCKFFFNLRIPIFNVFWGFLARMLWNIATLSMLESLEAIAVQKSPRMPLWIFFTFFTAFSFFSKMPINCVKMIFQTPNKGSTCFKHDNFLNFDEKQLLQKFGSTGLQISLFLSVKSNYLNMVV